MMEVLLCEAAGSTDGVRDWQLGSISASLVRLVVCRSILKSSVGKGSTFGLRSFGGKYCGLRLLFRHFVGCFTAF